MFTLLLEAVLKALVDVIGASPGPRLEAAFPTLFEAAAFLI